MTRTDPKDPSGMSRWAALRSLGIPPDEMNRPLVAVFAAGQGLTGGAALVEEWASAASLGVQSAGGNPVVFRLPGVFSSAVFGDGQAWLDEAALAWQVERLARGLNPDACVLIADSEAGLAGLLRGAARVDLPAVALPGDGTPFDLGGPQVLGLAAEYGLGKISRDEWKLALENILAGPGLQDGFPSHFKFLVEAAGLSLPGASTLSPASPAKRDMARKCGWQAVTLANTGQRMSQQLSPRGLRNALAVDASLGGSSQGIWGLCKVAGELGAGIQRAWISPDKAKSYLKRPGGTAPSLAAWHAEGGVLSLLLLLHEAGAVDPSARLVTRGSLKDAFGDAAFPEQPVSLDEAGKAPETRMFCLKGGLAPNGLLLKAPAAGAAYEGAARVFDSEDEACQNLLKRPANPGEVVILRSPGSRAAALSAVLRTTQAPCAVLSDAVLDSSLPQVSAFRLPAAPGDWEALKTGTRISLRPAQAAVEAEPSRRTTAKPPEGLAGLEWERLQRFQIAE